MEKIKALYRFGTRIKHSFSVKEKFFVFKSEAPDATAEKPEPIKNQREEIEKAAEKQRKVEAEKAAKTIAFEINQKKFENIFDDPEENETILSNEGNLDKIIDFAQESGKNKEDNMEAILVAVHKEEIKAKNLSKKALDSLFSHAVHNEDEEELTNTILVHARENQARPDQITQIFNLTGDPEKYADLADKTLEAREEGEVKAGMLEPKLVASLLEHYSKKPDQEKINLIFKEFTKDTAGTSALIESMAGLTKHVEKVYKSIEKKQELIKGLSTNAIGILINSVGIEKILPNITDIQKLNLLTNLDEKIKLAEKKADEDKIVDAIIQSMDLKTIKFENKKIIIESKGTNQKLKDALKASLSEPEKTAAEPTPAPAPAEPEPAAEGEAASTDAEDEPASIKLNENTPLETMLEQSGLNKDTRHVGWTLDLDASTKSERDFVKSPKFLAAFETKKGELNTPDKVKLFCYEYLYNEIYKGDTIGNKYNLENFNDSQAKLKAEIARLKASVENKPAQAAATPTAAVQTPAPAMESAPVAAGAAPAPTTISAPAATTSVAPAPAREAAPAAKPETSEADKKAIEAAKKLSDELKTLLQTKDVFINGATITIADKTDKSAPRYKIEGNILSYRIKPGNALQVFEIKKETTAQTIAEVIKKADRDNQIAIADFKKFGQRIDTKNFKLKDFNAYSTIPENVSKFIASDDFSTKFQQLKNAELYKDMLTRHLKVEETQVANKLQAIVTDGMDERIYPADFLNKADAEGFEKHFNELLKKVNGPGYEGKEQDLQELQEMYDTFIAIEKIIAALETESVSEVKIATTSQELSEEIAKLEAIGGDPDTLYYNLDEVDTDKFASENSGQVRIGVEKNTISKFATVYKEVTGKDFGERTPDKVLTALNRGYTKQELIGNQKIVKKVQNPPNTNATYLVITDLPKNFDKDNLAVREMMINIDKETLVAKEEDNLGWDVDALTPEQEHVENVEGMRAASSTDSERYHNKMVGVLQEGEKRDRREMIGSVFTDAVDPDVERTADKDVSYQLTGGVSDIITAEAMAEQLTDTQKVKIKNKKGKEVELQLFTMEHGVKVFKDKNLRTYFNYLIKLGHQRMLREDEFKKKLNLDDYEENEMLGNIKYLDTKKTVLEQEFTASQIEALRQGYLEKLDQDKTSQQHEDEKKEIKYSENEEVAKIQKAAEKMGYPRDQIENIPAKVIGGLGAKLKGGKLQDIGGGINIPIGDNFHVAVGLSNSGLETGVGLTWQIHKSATTDVSAGAGLRATISGEGITTAVIVGFFPKTQLGDSNLDIGLGLGTMLSLEKGSVVIMPTLQYNEARATEEAKNENIDRLGFRSVENAKTIEAKAIELRKHKLFKAIEKDLDDVDLVAVYEEQYRPMIVRKAMSDSDPTIPITGGGIGVAFGWDWEKGKFHIGAALGLEIKLGEYIIYKPYRGERTRLAKNSSQDEINRVLAEQMNAQKILSQEVKFTKINTGDLYIDAKGNLNILDRENSSKTTLAPSNLEQLETDLQDVQMRALIVPLKSGETTKRALRLLIDNTEHKNSEVHVDARAQEMGIIFDENTQSIYIPGHLKNVVITRERFRSMSRLTEGGAATEELITINSNAEFDRNAITQNSRTILRKNWVDGKSTLWSIENGPATQGESQIHTLAEYQEGKVKQTFEDFTETVHNIPKAEWDLIQNIAKSNRKPRENFDKQTVRENWLETSKTIYKRMEKDLDSGTPAINDFESIITKANTILESLKQPKIDPENGDKEAGQLLTVIQHEYFINLWRPGEKRNRTLKRFEENNKAIRDQVLKPKFKDAIVRLGIKGESEAENYAAEMAKRVVDLESAKFLKALDSLGNPPDLSKLNTIVKPIDQDKLFYSGTFVRATKQAELTGGPKLFSIPGSKIPTMGTIGETTKWPVDDSQLDKDIARVILETLSPKLSLTDKATLKSPLAQKLAAFEGTGVELGSAKFAVVRDYMRNPSQALEAGLETVTALEEFIKFANKAREASKNGKTITVNLGDGEKTYSLLETKNGARILVPKAQAESAPYGECGNLSLLAGEEFVLVLPLQGKIIVAGSERLIHENRKISEDSVKLLLGLIAEPDEDKEKPTPSAGSGGSTDQEAGDETGGASQTVPAQSQDGAAAQGAKAHE